MIDEQTGVEFVNWTDETPSKILTLLVKLLAEQHGCVATDIVIARKQKPAETA